MTELKNIVVRLCIIAFGVAFYVGYTIGVFLQFIVDAII